MFNNYVVNDRRREGELAVAAGPTLHDGCGRSNSSVESTPCPLRPRRHWQAARPKMPTLSPSRPPPASLLPQGLSQSLSFWPRPLWLFLAQGSSALAELSMLRAPQPTPASLEWVGSPSPSCSAPWKPNEAAGDPYYPWQLLHCRISGAHVRDPQSLQ